MTNIVAFLNEHRYLSNFYPVSVVYEGDWYPSTEHAYQAAKTIIKEERIPFMDPKLKAYEAKKLGLTVTLRDDWDEETRIGIMSELVLQKFTNQNSLRNALCATEGEIIEGNTWGDVFWGECPVGKGRNELGKILMKTRDILKWQ